MAGDLTQQLAKFLDRHLVFPLLEYLSNKHLYDDDDIQKAKISLLAHTNMVDYAMDIYATLYNTDKVPQDMKDRRTEARVQTRSKAALKRPAVVEEPRSCCHVAVNAGDLLVGHAALVVHRSSAV